MTLEFVGEGGQVQNLIGGADCNVIAEQLGVFVCKVAAEIVFGNQILRFKKLEVRAVFAVEQLYKLLVAILFHLERGGPCF